MKMGRPFLRAAWTQTAEPWKKIPGLRGLFLRKRLAEDFLSRLILLFSPEADAPGGNFSQFLQLTILARPSQDLWPRAPVIPLVSFSVPLSLPALASFLGLAFQASPWSVSLFPCPCPPQSAFLALRSGHPPASFSVPLFWPIPGQPLWPIILYIFVVSLDYWA